MYRPRSAPSLFALRWFARLGILPPAVAGAVRSGAGDGTVSALALETGAVPVACDLSGVQLGRARARIPGLRAVRADAEQLPFSAPGGVVGLTAWPPDSLIGEMNAAVREASGFASRFPDQELGWGVSDVAAERFGRHAGQVETRRLSFVWDPAVRSSAGKDDYAARYVARHLPGLDFGATRERILERHLDDAGNLIADYLLVTGRAR